MNGDPYVFILSWERPIFLWATLDSLYRNTRKSVNFVLVDNNSRDPLVRQVIDGFIRRDMFHKVHLFEDNSPDRMNLLLQDYYPELGEFFYFVENDVIVPESICWASEYERIFRHHEQVAMIGSFCDQRDFIDPASIKKCDPGLSDAEIEFFAKTKSPERHVHTDLGSEVWGSEWPTPPGRLLLLDTDVIRATGFRPDSVLAHAIRRRGYRYAICTSFNHRHLSLLNWYDVHDPTYPDSRRLFFQEMSRRTIRMRVSDFVRRRIR